MLECMTGQCSTNEAWAWRMTMWQNAQGQINFKLLMLVFILLIELDDYTNAV